MKNKKRKVPYKPTLILGELVEITDPAEQAELDRRFAAAERAVEGEYVTRRKTKPRKKR